MKLIENNNQNNRYKFRTLISKLKSKRYDISFRRMVFIISLTIIITMALTLHSAVTTPLISKLNIVGENRWATIEEFFSRVIKIEDVLDGEQFSEKYYKYLGADKSYPLREEIKESIYLIDSLSREVELWRLYARNISDILAGKKESLSESDSIKSIITSAPSVNVARIALDSLLRDNVNLRLDASNKQMELNRIHTPLAGRIIKPFSRKNNHLGILISPSIAFAPVMAADQGTIIDIKWDTRSGYTIYVQHIQNMMSVYKNVSSVLKKKGENIRAQEVIGYIGSESESVINGEYALYFELWSSGMSIDPEKHLIF